MDNKLLSAQEAAKHLKISPSTLSRWDKSGKLTPSKTPQGHRRYSKTVLDAFLYPDPVSHQPSNITNPSVQEEVRAINKALAALPPGGSTSFPISPITNYVGITQVASKFYRNVSDQALRNDRKNAVTMMNSLSVMAPLQERMLATAGKSWHIEPDDSNDPYQVQVAEEHQQNIKSIRDFFKLRFQLLWALWRGREAVMLSYDWRRQNGKKTLAVSDWVSINGDSVIFKYNSKDFGIYTGFATGLPGTKLVDTEPADISRAHVVTNQNVEYFDDNGHPYYKVGTNERDAYILHHHYDVRAGDFMDPLSAGGIFGNGIRSTIYWTWLAVSNIQGWLLDFLQRVGQGITIYRYLRGDAESYAAVRSVAESNSNEANLLFPIDPVNGQTYEDIERIEPSPAGIDNMMKVLDTYFNSQIRRFITGQDSTSMPVMEGLGSKIAGVQENTFGRIVNADCMGLEETLTHQLVDVLHRYNHPEADFKCRFKIDEDKPDAESVLKAIHLAWEMGVSFIESEVRSVTGMSEPQATDKIIKRTVAQPHLPGQKPGQNPGEEEADDLGEQVPGDDLGGDDPAAEADPEEYIGPRGGKGRRDPNSGRVRYEPKA